MSHYLATPVRDKAAMKNAEVLSLLATPHRDRSTTLKSSTIRQLEKAPKLIPVTIGKAPIKNPAQEVRGRSKDMLGSKYDPITNPIPNNS